MLVMSYLTIEFMPSLRIRKVISGFPPIMALAD
jgi:hypothetical protein